jgi:hypothetical protein
MNFGSVEAGLRNSVLLPGHVPANPIAFVIKAFFI